MPGGYHPGSGRLAEVLSAGCIPVLVGDDYVLPFNAVLDWSSLAFTVCATCVDDRGVDKPDPTMLYHRT